MTTIPMTMVNNSATVMRNTIAKVSTTALSANTETTKFWHSLKPLLMHIPDEENS